MENIESNAPLQAEVVMEPAEVLTLPQEQQRELMLKRLARRVQIPARFISDFRLVRRSLDARGGKMLYKCLLRYATNGASLPPLFPMPLYRDVHNAPESAIIVGAGPAGLFAALHLLKKGIKPIIIERGADVHTRRRDIAQMIRTSVVNPNSNYCFGEGGAGTFSDGKLYTRSTKRGDLQEVLSQLVHFGAEEEIMVEAHPHIGTDKLPTIIENIRKKIVACGGEFHLSTIMYDLLPQSEGGAITGWRVICKKINGESGVSGELEFLSKNVILAAGHSAKEIYQLFYQRGWSLEAKGFAMGVRVEHPQQLINRLRYHLKREPGGSPAGRLERMLPAAEYSAVCQVDGRGVFSFCMCPGGILVPSMTEAGEMVLNGMSNSGRDSKWANAGVVVQIEPEDIHSFEEYGPLKLLKFQEAVEQRIMSYCREAEQASGGRVPTIKAPAQRMQDFMNGKISASLPKSSYMAGTISAPLHKLLPKLVAKRLKEGFKEFDRRMRGYCTNDALLLAVESRTSSPVRIVRNPETLQAPGLPGIYPCGEGAGYSGGIVSSAIDGINAAEAIATAQG